MHSQLWLALGLLCSSARALPSPKPSDDPRAASDDVSEAFDQLRTLSIAAQDVATAELPEHIDLAERGLQQKCTLKNLRIRREWGSLSSQERKDYIQAVQCLVERPSKTPPELIPDARNRLDDFVGTHINQTQTIHYTGNFLSWHRHFVHSYEEALRNECGYEGTQPYWDWAKTAITGLENSPIFDGSDTSMSGNGEFIPNREEIVLGGNGLPDLPLPAGTGGGCVTSGPFKDLKINLGPVALDVPGGPQETNPAGPLEFDPRCLKRDLTDEVNRRFANASSIVSNILNPKDIDTFQLQMQGVPGSGDIGIHGGGHYSLGGDPGRDVSTSPGDPAFYLHHAMIDRVWWIWQSLSPQERQTNDTAIAGTNTFLNMPPSADTTLDNVVDLGFAAGPPTKIRDLLSINDGPFCYIYL